MLAIACQTAGPHELNCSPKGAQGDKKFRLFFFLNLIFFLIPPATPGT